jgi:hypothetical protein
LFSRFNRFISIEGCPADDQFEEQHNQGKHKDQGNNHPTKVKYQPERPGDHQKRENCPEDQSTSMMPTSALAGECLDSTALTL